MLYKNVISECKIAELSLITIRLRISYFLGSVTSYSPFCCRLSVGERKEFLASISDENLSAVFQQEKTMKMHSHQSRPRHHPHVRGTLPDCVLDTFDLCDDVFPESKSRCTPDLQEGETYCSNLFDSFDHTIRMSFEMEDVIVFHYLKESCLIDVNFFPK